jgi:hypothetical protein
VCMVHVCMYVCMVHVGMCIKCCAQDQIECVIIL